MVELMVCILDVAISFASPIAQTNCPYSRMTSLINSGGPASAILVAITWWALISPRPDLCSFPYPYAYALAYFVYSVLVYVNILV